MWAVQVVSTHMFECVMGHRQRSSLLQVVVPVEVGDILSRVSIWNTHKQNSFLLSNLLSKNISSYSFHAAVHRVALTRLQWLLTHAGAPSRPTVGALRRSRGGILSSNQSKWTNERRSKTQSCLAELPSSVTITLPGSHYESIISELFSTTVRWIRRMIPLFCICPLSSSQAKPYQPKVTKRVGHRLPLTAVCQTWHLTAKSYAAA